MCTRTPGRRRRESRAGAVSAEVVIATPLLLLMILLVIQFALWQHAVDIATAAAQQGANAARVDGGTQATGMAETQATLDRLGPSLINQPQITVLRTADIARVEVTGYAESLIPWLHLAIHGVAQGAVERFRSTPGATMP